jgi:hypothetical protein
MHHDRDSGRQQFRPRAQIQDAFAGDVKLIHIADNTPHDPSGDDLTAPRDRRRPEGKGKVVDLLAIDGVRLVVEGEVRIHVFVGAVVQDEDLAEEGEHGHVFSDVADEDAAAAEFAVVGVGLVVEADDCKERVEGGGHAEGLENNEGGGGEDLEDNELGG